MQYLCIKLTQYNEYIIHIVMAWCFSTRASVATVLSTHSYISQHLMVNSLVPGTVLFDTVRLEEHIGNFAHIFICFCVNGFDSYSTEAHSWVPNWQYVGAGLGNSLVAVKLTLINDAILHFYKNKSFRFISVAHDDKSTLYQVMDWHLLALSNYMSQCWPISGTITTRDDTA